MQLCFLFGRKRCCFTIESRSNFLDLFSFVVLLFGVQFLCQLVDFLFNGHLRLCVGALAGEKETVERSVDKLEKAFDRKRESQRDGKNGKQWLEIDHKILPGLKR